MTDITVHHLERSRSHRIIWLLEELGLPYTVKIYLRDPHTNLAPAELKRVHPLGKSPVVEVGGVVLAESALICKHLVLQANSSQWQFVQSAEFWLHFSEGSMMPYLLMDLVFEKTTQANMPFGLAWLVRPVAKGIAKAVQTGFIAKNINTQLSFIESHLEGNTYLCDAKLSVADIMMAYPLACALERGWLKPNQHPSTCAYLGRLQARPAYVKAGQYDYSP